MSNNGQQKESSPTRKMKIELILKRVEREGRDIIELTIKIPLIEMNAERRAFEGWVLVE